MDVSGQGLLMGDINFNKVEKPSNENTELYFGSWDVFILKIILSILSIKCTAA